MMSRLHEVEIVICIVLMVEIEGRDVRHRPWLTQPRTGNIVSMAMLHAVTLRGATEAGRENGSNQNTRLRRALE
ncbi:hypothetical protein CC1G_15642 [Coprinopsis cinerea okayama7|uniref:Uncharacterized protein n=1 Tax=Coprinopsis cinerea (strain Okayama-7 / 130 / ATCC MYA-4618 / FGSC 9003) TaxID=240176 RepID=D6RQA5_COPC7|nr:hypothetical protein CC1G_15642 [Coprinopsis cinerea okayama7\|eukprot:XP_002910215.1 hypothetical protein CC1G_15642 [Coprinopsis cinerea okayama7\